MDIINKPIYEATHRGYLKIGDKDLPCAVLENGKRIISHTGLFQAFDRPSHGAKRVDGLPSVVSANNFLEFITPEFEEKAEVIYYKHTNGRTAKGFDAELIPLICELYLDANQHGKLYASQIKLAERALIIIRALSKVGITALIDEATGYQYDRQRQELQILLEAYIAKDLMEWTKRFPNDYYEEIYRLHTWDFNPNKSNRPQYIGFFTNKYIYDFFPEEVIKEIKKKNPVIANKGYRKNKLFQYLTTGIGIKQLDDHMSRLTTVMRLSNDLQEFKSNFYKGFKREIDNMPDEKRRVYTKDLEHNLTLF
jgi:hypothetical protein